MRAPRFAQLTQLLTLGGIIGTGLFLGTGNALVKGGPVGLFLGYALYGCVLIW